MGNEKPVSFEVTSPRYEDLTEDERDGASNNGSGKEYASYLRVSRNGETKFLESDAMEPEDARLSRDLSWVKSAIEFAYQCGREDFDALQQRERKLREALRTIDGRADWCLARGVNQHGADSLTEICNVARAALRSSDHIEGEQS